MGVKAVPVWLIARHRELRVAVDAAVLAIAFLLSYQLRFEFAVPAHRIEWAFAQLPMVLMCQLGAMAVCGVYGLMWRYIGLPEVAPFLRSAVLSLVPLLALRFWLPPELVSLKVPISVALLTTGIGFGGVIAARLAFRAVWERYDRERKRHEAGARCDRRPVRTLLVGAGQAGVLAVRELGRQPHCDLGIVGFVDDDRDKVGKVLHGVRVLGSTADLARLVGEQQVEQLVVTMVRVERTVLRQLVGIGKELGIPVRLMPGLHDILEGRVNVSQLRDVRIEDLLGRDPVELDDSALRAFLAGRRVLVTGAGGSIGSELARQVALLGPEELLLLDRAEPALFNVHRELGSAQSRARVVPVVADVGDEVRMRAVLSRHRPQVVLHAAAHKHVPLMEENPAEAIWNNTLATRVLGRLAAEHGAETFVLVSTDKAVRPTSVMGASKRVAELVVQGLDRLYPTRFLAVRFGNVLGSTGSVIPIFREQIAAGGPVTVTHPEMVRYFMTIPEAAQLVLQAATMGDGGEIFVLDMGEPVRILDLARDMVRLSGLQPDVDIEIVITGPRPGEKLYEELEHSGEGLDRTRHPKIFVGRLEPYPDTTLGAALRDLETLCTDGDGDRIRRFLGRLLPEAALSVPAHPDARPRLRARASG